MENMYIPFDQEDFRDEFVCRVMNQFSQWGLGVENILSMMEQCADDIERFDIIESCLKKLSEFQLEPEVFLWQSAVGDLKDLELDASIAVGCKDLLKEMDTMQDGSIEMQVAHEWAA